MKYDIDFYMKSNGNIPVQDNKCILLHGFIKKTMKTPSKEIERARKYMEDYIRRSKL